MRAKRQRTAVWAAAKLFALASAAGLCSACGSDAPAAGDGGGHDMSADRSAVDGPSLTGDGGGAMEAAIWAPDANGVSCAFACHGSAASPAPPLGVHGEAELTARAVGAHQVHLRAASWHVNLPCNSCHNVPGQVGDSGHIDTPLPAEVVFSSLAQSGGVQASWDGTGCTTYCHGASLSGGTATTPRWTQVDGTQVTCTGCHGMPPGGSHPQRADCAACHGQVVNAAGQITAPALHLNGQIELSAGAHPDGFNQGNVHGPAFFAQPNSCGRCHGATLTGGSGPSCETCHAAWKSNCTFCHGGTDNTTGAPPRAVSGATARTDKAVGAHTAHVAAGSTHVAFGCTVCHVNPTDALSAGHVDASPAELTFSGVAQGGSYDAAAGRCTVYCHGTGKPNARGEVLWTANLSGCNSCHINSGSGRTLSGHHGAHLSENVSCSACHGTVVDASQHITSASRHVNGAIDVSGSFSWNASAKSCSGGCHSGTRQW